MGSEWFSNGIFMALNRTSIGQRKFFMIFYENMMGYIRWDTVTNNLLFCVFEDEGYFAKTIISIFKPMDHQWISVFSPFPLLFQRHPVPVELSK